MPSHNKNRPFIFDLGTGEKKGRRDLRHPFKKLLILYHYWFLRHSKYEFRTHIASSSGTGAGYGLSPLSTMVTWLS